MPLMPRKSADTLEAFVPRQDAATLADVLLELAKEHNAVRNFASSRALRNASCSTLIIFA